MVSKQVLEILKKEPKFKDKLKKGPVEIEIIEIVPLKKGADQYVDNKGEEDNDPDPEEDVGANIHPMLKRMIDHKKKRTK